MDIENCVDTQRIEKLVAQILEIRGDSQQRTWALQDDLDLIGECLQNFKDIVVFKLF